jgi:hypothetical protein
MSLSIVDVFVQGIAPSGGLSGLPSQICIAVQFLDYPLIIVSTNERGDGGSPMVGRGVRCLLRDAVRIETLAFNEVRHKNCFSKPTVTVLSLSHRPPDYWGLMMCRWLCGFSS